MTAHLAQKYGSVSAPNMKYDASYTVIHYAWRNAYRYLKAARSMIKAE